ncbi:low specificity L-threonine aldolase [Roseibium sp. TrichSKD4]|uniref:threonine aldolase family protein n=1 Tax=Roseibium sp. TrichSKD4 TaxID=744980 RepID=UPI0002FDD0CB|nr:low specificity L-threonine aldolase [Roseibium sp. TrichSKD4]
MNFASDNWAGASDAVMAALARHNAGPAPAYGSDPLTVSMTERFSELFEREVAVYFVGTGTAANSLSLAAYGKPGGVIFCHQDSHIQVDECGCPEFMTSGGKLVGVPGEGGKMTPGGLREKMSAFPDGVVHHGQVAAVSLTQATESGTVYSLAEIEAIKSEAAARNVPLHMDGARFANALVSLSVTPAEMTWKTGVDVLSFGATKNGCWCAEAVVFFDLETAKGFEYFRKRGGHLFSKSRFVAAQFDGYFENNAWLETARHANAMASKLEVGIQSAGGRFPWPVQANELFPVIKRSQFGELKEVGAHLYDWPSSGLPESERPSDDEVMVRMVASFATTEAEVEEFLAQLKG